MRTLAQSLQDHDPGYLRIVAELWGLDLSPGSTVEQLSAALLAAAPELALPDRALPALHRLQRAGGRLPFEELARRYGPLREMGAGRRDRLKPWREPVSPLEMLWYRGLVGRAFADADEGPREFGFIPSDLLGRLPAIGERDQVPLGEPADKPAGLLPASTWIVDDATTLLANLRRSPQIASDERRRSLGLGQPYSAPLLLTLLEDLIGDSEQTAAFLRLERGAALQQLQRSWAESSAWNDLAQLASIQAPDGEWPNDPLAGRRAAISFFRQVPAGRWWSTSRFIEAVHSEHAEFLRPPGGFEAWYIQRVPDGAFLRGFEHWDAIEGEYLRYLLRGPLHWLGAADLSEGHAAFRLTPLSHGLLDSAATLELPARTGPTVVGADGLVRVARFADRSLRYQIARLTAWEGLGGERYHYRISAQALQSAETHGLTAAHLAKILTQATGHEPPAGVSRALERWSANRLEAAIQEQLILRVEEPQVLERLSEHRATRRFIQELLGPNRAVVNTADWRAFQAESLKLGLLIAGLEPDPDA